MPDIRATGPQFFGRLAVGEECRSANGAFIRRIGPSTFWARDLGVETVRRLKRDCANFGWRLEIEAESA